MNSYQHRINQYWNQLHRCEVLHTPAATLYTTEHASDAMRCVNLMVLSPAMNAYVIWLLRKAAEFGIRRLYFLARDGYLVYATATKYCRQLNLPIECRYLYCSRYSLRVPMYHKDLDVALAHICRGGIRITPRKLMLRSGFSQEQADEILPQLDLPYEPDACIPYAHLSQIRDTLKFSQTYITALSDTSLREWPALKGYFVQEGLLDECSMGIVDSGWTGSMQTSIQQIRQLCGCKNSICGFYYGIYHLPHSSTASEYNAFAFYRCQHLGRKIFFNNNFFETVYSSPHGSTQGYRYNDSAYVPVLTRPDPQIKDFILTLEQQMSSYTDELLQHLSLRQFTEIPIHQLQRTVCGLFRLLMWSPTPQEAEQFGRMPFSDDLLDDGTQELAVLLSAAQLQSNHLLPKLLAMTSLRPRPLHESAWYEGSAVRFGVHPRWDRFSYTLYRILLYLKPR